MKYLRAIGIFLFYYILVGSLVIPMLTALINVSVGIDIPHGIGPVVFFFIGILFAVKSLRTSRPPPTG